MEYAKTAMDIYFERYPKSSLVEKVARSLEEQYGDGTYPSCVVDYAEQLIQMIKQHKEAN